MKPIYNSESEQKISNILLEHEWADEVHWDRNDWYIQWSSKTETLLYRIPAVLKFWYDLNESDLKCVEFMKRYFALDRSNPGYDELSINMQEAIIGLAQKKLNKALPSTLTDKVRNSGWSYMGLEMILDTVKSMEGKDIEEYLANLK